MSIYQMRVTVACRQILFYKNKRARNPMLYTLISVKPLIEFGTKAYLSQRYMYISSYTL